MAAGSINTNDTMLKELLEEQAGYTRETCVMGKISSDGALQDIAERRRHEVAADIAALRSLMSG